ncbi:hypothetical protein C0Q70_17636 [Pomacea canaliculata]|uniref:Casein kinase II subunit beta n=1 Tax=Pomacea canaliculata TaxID=400727 RepID=A0A2T7NKZ0_POMCA|nr:hypothetical protein C0Q70_17636 [Pomacea canaliculata]
MLPLPLDTEDDLDDNPSSDLIEQAAEMLYGLIHARFILTNAGIYDELEDNPNQSDLIEQAAEMLYGLIHARYIMTNRGIAQMIEKWQQGDFGYCPRCTVKINLCFPLINVFLKRRMQGLSDVPGEAMVKLYCPKCQDAYTPKSSRHHHTDGAYFGTGFPHMLFMVHPEYRPKRPANQFVPRLYGFKIHPLAYQLQYQAAANFKMPMRGTSHPNSKR